MMDITKSLRRQMIGKYKESGKSEKVSYQKWCFFHLKNRHPPYLVVTIMNSLFNTDYYIYKFTENAYIVCQFDKVKFKYSITYPNLREEAKHGAAKIIDRLINGVRE